ncbi:hypothetical protein M758_1G328300 [Ceratodon purpureus]|uniref:S-protein homolog n=1 Tax=Ceratodon purpureus TaxID=3225 RepID=A0A8T0JFS7_CERPU|nr:hypothetical protein KC19_1G335800 [Ceratodon purpureus]KAG0632435.1 hypothetical protein M758_1G328300 [Ceratodon purpureus]
MHSSLSSEISNMAKQSLRVRVSPIILVVLFMITSSPMAEVEAAALTLSFGNTMQQEVNIHCHSSHGDLGHNTIRPGIGWYAFTIPNSDTTGDEYWCQFESAGKPSTYIQVFVGRNAVDNMPCHCSGSQCTWIIEDRGISCNLYKYFHSWGGALK